MKWNQVKDIWKKVWHFIWEEDSWLSWIVNIILAFLIIKFIVYPILGFVFSTTHPIVAVVSGSMEHDESFEDWWDSKAQCGVQLCTQGEHYAQYGIMQDEFLKYKYKNGFNKGDIIILYGKDPGEIKRGDVLVFEAGKSNPIIHRVVKVTNSESEVYYTTKGDHNPTSSNFEKMISEDTIIGTGSIRIPYLGYIKIGFVKLLELIGLIR
ncbi:signal peptidase I [Candidatus Woesearchaeota archaeon]|jgi:signal peptidase I|nr:signal peptidase I [Candidatus Woesearchaeota archaeon]MBT6519227.1 signal peptidase I [Candidatus Woesearchaeota archaeon]MBT7367502.1 signal peptidase I [Candidatus Woesearchaeota archaeon]